ncbi:hypothetical protein [Streptomyces avermitilis]|uniref:hypothetical protein n=1 Tax=Streptomyces avermitilis TaxID=33903 RepID=UPI0034100454
MNDKEASQKFLLHLEIDTGGVSLVNQGVPLVDDSDLFIEIVDDQEVSHGFGLAEIVTISVMVGSGVASELIASCVKSSVKAIIRRVAGRNNESDGSTSGLTAVIEAERQGQSDENETR